MAASWIDRALAIRTVDGDDVPTDGKFRIWKFANATLTPDGDRLVITIARGELLSGGGGSVDLRDGGFVIDATAPILVSAAGGISIDVGDLTIETPYHVIAAQAPTLGAHLTNKAYVDALIAAGVPASISNNTSLTGPADITHKAADGYNFILGDAAATGSPVTSIRSGQAGSVDLHTTASAPIPNGGDIDAMAAGDLVLSGASATSGVSICAGGVATRTLASGEVRVRGIGLTLRANGSPATPSTGQVLVQGDEIRLTGPVDVVGDLTLRGRPLGDDWLVDAIASSNIDLSAPGSTIDGVTMSAGMTFAVVAQSTDTQCGVYRYVDASSPATRHESFDTLAEYKIGTRVRAAQGSANEGKSWYLNGLDTSLPASWVALPGGSGGGGASISDSGASVDTTGGDVLTEVPSGGEFRVQYDGDTVFRYVGGIATIDAPGDNVSIAPTAGTLDLGGGGVSAVTLTSGGTADITTAGTCMVTAGSTYAVSIGLGGTTAGYGIISAGGARIRWYTNEMFEGVGLTGALLQSTGADVILDGATGVHVRAAGAVKRISFRTPADTATTDATLTTLTNLVPTARPSTYPIVVHAWDASLNVAKWRVDEAAVLRSGAADFVGGAPAGTYPMLPTVSDAALATCTLTVDKSSTNIRVRGAGVVATNLTWASTVPGECK